MVLGCRLNYQNLIHTFISFFCCVILLLFFCVYMPLLYGIIIIWHYYYYDCAELGWRCIPLAVENYGAWGPQALRAFSQVAPRLAICDNTPKSKVVAEVYGHLSLSLIRANMRPILVHSYYNKNLNCACS